MMTASIPSTTHAQKAPYANYLVGERALGLAGAFVALGDDASALFHNPAGTAQLSTGTISGSLWALSMHTRDADYGLRTDYGSTKFGQNDITSLPLFIGGVAKVGAKDAHGRRNHALGIGLFRPYRDDYHYRSLVGSRADEPVRELDIWHEDDALWLGVNYAQRYDDKLMLGVSAFFVRRSIDHEEAEFSASENDAPLLGRSAQASVRDHRIALRVGALYRLDHRFRFGVMAQLPAIPLSSTAEIATLGPRFVDDGATQPAGFARRTGSAQAHLSMPWEVRGGVTYAPTESTLLTLDLSLVGSAGSIDQPVIEDAPEVLLLSRSTRQLLSARAALGFEWVVADTLPLRGGLLFELPRTPALPRTSDNYMQRRMTTAGVALSIGFRSDGFDFSLGTTALISRGTGLGLVRDNGWASASYERADAVDKSIFVYLAGGRSAVELVVDKVKPILAPD